MQEYSSVIPPEFFCPITQSIMIFPHLDGQGNSFEGAALRRWLANGKTKSPLSRLHLTVDMVIPNVSLRNVIEKWRNDNIL